MTRVALVLCIAAVSGPAQADWCLDHHRAEVTRQRGQPPGPARTPRHALPTTEDGWAMLSVHGVDLRLPRALHHRTLAGVEQPGSLFEVSVKPGRHSRPEESMGDCYAPMLHAHIGSQPGDPAAAADALMKALAQKNRALYPASVRLETRPIPGGVEVCGVLSHSPGHATLLDGTHRPLPTEYDLVHGHFLLTGGHLSAFYYRVPEADVRAWGPLLAKAVATLAASARSGETRTRP